MLTGRPEPCIPYVEKALRLNPRDGSAYMNLGKCISSSAMWMRPMPLLRKAEAIIPGYWAIHLKLAGALGLKGEIGRGEGEGCRDGQA